MQQLLSNTHSLSDLLSTVETLVSYTTRTALALAWVPLSTIIHTHVHAPPVLVVAVAYTHYIYMYIRYI